MGRNRDGREGGERERTNFCFYQVAHSKLEKLVAPECRPSDIQGHTITRPFTDLKRTAPTHKMQRKGAGHVLKGPMNPFEVSFYPMTRSMGMKAARVQQDSVNCIVVDSEPQDKHERLMVAGRVAVNSAGNTVLASATTLLPNIHGLIHLVVMLFTPCMELR